MRDSGTDRLIPYYADKEEASIGTEAVLNALILVNHDARRSKGVLNATTRKALRHLWEQQQENGAWLWLDFGLNPWEKDGAYYGACLAAIAVGSAGKAYGNQPEIQSRLAALKKYLNADYIKQPLHHRAMGLWASAVLPAILTETDKRALIAELLDSREADGGWSLAKLGKTGAGASPWKAQGVYPEGAVSDGYATGLIVLVLRRAGVAADHPALKGATDWLVTHQQDGTWPACYLNKARDPESNTGKFMRDAATAFAAMALSEVAGSGQGDARSVRPLERRP